MSSFNYGITGIGSNVQLGKRGGYINFNNLTDDGQNGTSPSIQFYQTDGKTLIRLQSATPLVANDVANKNYVDSVLQGLNLKASVYVATIPEGTVDGGSTVIGSGNIPLSGNLDSDNQLIIDGISVPENARILIKDQTNETENGIYVLSINSSDKTYSLTRSEDADNKDSSGNGNSELTSGTFVFVESGIVNADTGWVVSQPIGTVNIGTDNVVWVQFSSAGVTSAGSGLLKSGVVLSVNPDNVTIYNNSSGLVSIKSGTDGQVMISKSGNSSGTWGQLDLTKGVTGILPIENGGTGISSYNSGDILIGNKTGDVSTLSSLSIGVEHQNLSISNSEVSWNYTDSLYTSDGILTVKSNSSSTNTSYISIYGSDTSKGTGYDASNNIYSGLNLKVIDPTTSDVNLTFTPAGNGLILARSGYSSYIYSNYSRPTDGTTNPTPLIPDDALATIGFVMDNIIVPDTTRIYHEDSSGNILAEVSTNKSGYSDMAVISAQNNVIATFQYDSASDTPAISGEHLNVQSIAGEVQLTAIDTSTTDDVDMRLIPQGNGFVYLGSKGSGLIKSEDTFELTVSGGDGTSSVNAANIILKGGDSASSTTNGGNVIIQGGAATTTSGSISIGGDTFIKDSYGNNIIQFTNNNINNAANYFVISNSTDSTTQTISGLHFGVSNESVSTNISLYLNTIGTGLVRASNIDSYYAALTQSGSDDAFALKKYVDETVGGVNIPDGHGLTTYTDNGSTYRSVDFGESNTIGFDSSYNIVVKSGIAGTVLISQSGTGNTEAAWGKIDLSSQNSITNTLGILNGGTGINSYNIGDMLYSTSQNSLSTLSAAEASVNQVLMIGQTTGTSTNNIPVYQYMSSLYDSNGVKALDSIAVTNATNYLTITNSIQGTSPILSVATSGAVDNFLSLTIETGTSGLIYVNSTYSAALVNATNTNSSNALSTKGYVDSQIAAGGDPLMVKQNISSNFTNPMNIGNIKQAISNKKIVISQVEVDVQTALSGGSIDGMAIYLGTSSGTQIMDISENDILSPGLYIKNMNSTIDISNYQIVAYFYEQDGVTAAIPVSGNINVIIRYNIINA